MVYITSTIAWNIRRQLDASYSGILLSQIPGTADVMGIVHTLAVHDARFGAPCMFHADGTCSGHPEFNFRHVLMQVAREIGEPWIVAPVSEAPAWWSQ